MLLFEIHIQNLQVNIQLRHEFSVEIEPYKRKFIADAHTAKGEKPTFHLFSDVRIFCRWQRVLRYLWLCPQCAS